MNQCLLASSRVYTPKFTSKLEDVTFVGEAISGATGERGHGESDVDSQMEASKDKLTHTQHSYKYASSINIAYNIPCMLNSMASFN